MTDKRQQKIFMLISSLDSDSEASVAGSAFPLTSVASAVSSPINHSCSALTLHASGIRLCRLRTCVDDSASDSVSAANGPEGDADGAMLDVRAGLRACDGWAVKTPCVD